MYKLFNRLTLALFYAILFGCDSGPASNYPKESEGTSSSSATAKMPNSLPAGTRISFNPEITLNVEVSPGSVGQATYTNNSDSSDFGIGEEEILVQLELTPASLIVTYTLKNNEQVELVLTNFIDMGDDGYYDEFTVNATVNRNLKFSYVGHFRGLKKPRNLRRPRHCRLPRLSPRQITLPGGEKPLLRPAKPHLWPLWMQTVSSPKLGWKNCWNSGKDWQLKMLLE